jgi:hypothetical protein
VEMSNPKIFGLFLNCLSIKQYITNILYIVKS